VNTNSQTDSLIKEELKRTGGNISKVARALGLNYHAMLDQRKRELATRRVGITTVTEPEPSDIRTLGRPGHEHNVVAVKRQGQEWPKHFAAVIADARQKYDAGTHEMCQTTELNGWVILYLIPRLKPTERRNFFSTMVVM
jgi:transposase-like protein